MENAANMPSGQDEANVGLLSDYIKTYEQSKGEDVNHIRTLTNAVQQAIMAMGQAAYQTGPAAAGNPMNGEPAGGNGSAKDADEDIVEGEFEAA